MTPGEDNRMRADSIQITDVQPGDYFYLCSDGMLEQMSNDDLVDLLSSNVSDKEKRQLLIEATSHNQDNHTAWLIHIKDVIKEDADNQLVNEEPTSRCNALNIIPQTTGKEDVKIVEEKDDVVVVSTPNPIKKKLSLQKVVIVVLALFLALVVAWFLFLRNDDKEEQIRPTPVMQKPIRHDAKGYIKDSNKIDTNRIDSHESGN